MSKSATISMKSPGATPSKSRTARSSLSAKERTIPARSSSGITRSSNCSRWAGFNVSTVVVRATPVSTSIPTQTPSESKRLDSWPRL
eukprot:scaffold11939_cov73-Phaeocystis_antarctica.AAC.4